MCRQLYKNYFTKFCINSCTNPTHFKYKVWELSVWYVQDSRWASEAHKTQNLLQQNKNILDHKALLGKLPAQLKCSAIHPEFSWSSCLFAKCHKQKKNYNCLNWWCMFGLQKSTAEQVW